MKKENTIRVEMVRMDGDLAPFVEVDFMDKEAQEHTGIMLLDSGSTVNILSPEMADFIGPLCAIEDGLTPILSISQELMDFSQVRFSFVFGGNQFHETFCVSNRQLPIVVEGMTVVGILGNEFLQQHRLVIDYNDYTLHTSEVSPSNLSISDCTFFFPMEIGLKYYGVPVLPIKQNGKELVTMVDTGATNNMIAEQALRENDFKHRLIEKKDVIVNVTGEVEVGEARVCFNMLSLNSNDICEISRRARFKVLPCNIYTLPEGTCDTNGDQVPPIEALLGSPFLANEGWSLDFGAKIVYKRKSKCHLKEVA